jgi:hypothetical protein
MAAKHKSHGDHSTRRNGLEGKEASTGRSYADDRFKNPWNSGIEHVTGDEHSKTLYSPTSTVHGADLPLHHEYDDLWEKGK